MKLRGGVLIIAALLAALAAASTASAAEVYVSPTGGGAAACTVGDPCSLRHALEDVAADGDDVLLNTSAPYTVTSQIVLNTDDVYFFGQDDPAVIDTQTGGSILIDGQGDGVFNVNITGHGSVEPLQFSPFADNSVGSNLDVENIAGSAGALRSESTIQLTDSLFVSDAPSASTITAGDGSFLNVTSIANGATATAMTATDGIQGGGRVFVLNSILQGGTSNVDARATGPHAHLGLLASDLDNPVATAGGAIDVDTTGEAPNVAAPAHLNATYRELFPSPTIDAGYSFPDGSYPFDNQADLDLGFRCMGAGIDIGADEYDQGDVCAGFTDSSVPDDPGSSNFDFTAPVVTKFKAAKKKGKVTGFTFSSTEPGFATFSYQRKKGKKYKGAGTQRKITVAGPNSVKRKSLKKGSYKVTLRILDAAGNESSAKKLSFKIK